MNKAFVRESEEPEHQRCPACRAIGQGVGSATLSAHLPESEGVRLAGQVAYCANPSCDVGYFDTVGQTISASKIINPSWPKDPLASICACFGVTTDDVIAAAAVANPQPIRQLIARSKSSEADCLSRAASGSCCVPEVQQLYLKHLKTGRRV